MAQGFISHQSYILTRPRLDWLLDQGTWEPEPHSMGDEEMPRLGFSALTNPASPWRTTNYLLTLDVLESSQHPRR